MTTEPAKTSPNQAGAVGCLLFLVFGVILVGFATCSQSDKPPPAAKSIATAAPAIWKVETIDDTVFVDAKLPKASAEPDTHSIDTAAAVARRVAEAIQNNATDVGSKASRIAIDFTIPMQDRLGQVEDKTFMRLVFDLSDLRSAQIANLGSEGVLNLGTPKNYLGAARSIQSWCLFKQEKAPDFCEAGNMADLFDQQVKDAQETNAAARALSGR